MQTQLPILTKPNRRKLQAMQNAEIGRVSSSRRCKNDEAFAATTMQKWWSFRCLGLVRIAVVTMQKRWSFRLRDDAKTMKLQAPGFGQNRHLGLVRICGWVWLESTPGFSFVASFFFVLSGLPTTLLNRVHWARFAWTKSEFSRLDFFA